MLIEFKRCKPNYPFARLYVVEFDDCVKVGISTNIPDRFNSVYRKPWNKKILRYQCYSHPKAVEIELKVKREFKDSLVGNSTECFNLWFEDLISFIEKQNNFIKL